MRVLIFLFALVAACTASEPALDAPAPEAALPEAAIAPEADLDLDSLFTADLEGTFVLRDLATGTIQTYNAERAAERFLPASTYKIPNTLIALETGAASGPDFAIPWDSTEAAPRAWWPRSWRGDQTLATAFRNSVYWAYQDLARRIGEDAMRMYLAQFDYGNQSMGGGLDRFWLGGDLRISPLEQSAFLDKLYHGRLGVSERSTQIVRDLMVLEETDAYRLSGKTGTGEVTPTREIGWLVGFVEVGEEAYAYALNMEGERVWEDYPPQSRAAFVTRILRAVGTIP